MARRIYGDIDVRLRPEGGAVVMLKSATGEAFEIERSADQLATLREKLAPSITPSPAEPAETTKSKRRRDTVDVTTSEGETNA